MRWRQRVEAVLVGSELTFTHWLALHSARELIRRTGDVINQNDIAVESGFVDGHVNQRGGNR
ncbi:MAG TPA: hypothetical protein VGM44_23090 [Polyangiaceae bacterium]|jgi:hypothetical protein